MEQFLSALYAVLQLLLQLIIDTLSLFVRFAQDVLGMVR